MITTRIHPRPNPLQLRRVVSVKITRNASNKNRKVVLLNPPIFAYQPDGHV
jgi:hypothetical protein